MAEKFQDVFDAKASLRKRIERARKDFKREFDRLEGDIPSEDACMDAPGKWARVMRKIESEFSDEVGGTPEWLEKLGSRMYHPDIYPAFYEGKEE